MKTSFEYIHFTEVFSKLAARKTRVFRCRNNRSGDTLGIVEYYTGWRQYVFAPVEGAVFNTKCLFDILGFIGTLNEERTQQPAKEAA